MVSLLKRERRHFLTMLFDSCIDEKKTLNPRRESGVSLGEKAKRLQNNNKCSVYSPNRLFV